MRVDIYDIKNYKQCRRKLYDAWVCTPEIGTVVVDRCHHYEVNLALGGSYFSPHTLSSFDSTLMGLVKASVEKGLALQVTVERPYLVADPLGGYSVLSLEELSSQFSFISDDRRADITPASIERRMKRKMLYWTQVQSRPDDNTYWACFVPTPETGVVTNNGVAVFYNRAESNHGKGDFIVAFDAYGKPNLNTIRVVNGMLFGALFNNQGWTDKVEPLPLNYKPKLVDLYAKMRTSEQSEDERKSKSSLKHSKAMPTTQSQVPSYMNVGELPADATWEASLGYVYNWCVSRGIRGASEALIGDIRKEYKDSTCPNVPVLARCLSALSQLKDRGYPISLKKLDKAYKAVSVDEEPALRPSESYWVLYFSVSKDTFGFYIKIAKRDDAPIVLSCFAGRNMDIDWKSGACTTVFGLAETISGYIVSCLSDAKGIVMLAEAQREDVHLYGDIARKCVETCKEARRNLNVSEKQIVYARQLPNNASWEESRDFIVAYFKSRRLGGFVKRMMPFFTEDSNVRALARGLAAIMLLEEKGFPVTLAEIDRAYDDGNADLVGATSKMTWVLCFTSPDREFDFLLTVNKDGNTFINIASGVCAAEKSIEWDFEAENIVAGIASRIAGYLLQVFSDPQVVEHHPSGKQYAAICMEKKAKK